MFLFSDKREKKLLEISTTKCLKGRKQKKSRKDIFNFHRLNGKSSQGTRNRMSWVQYLEKQCRQASCYLCFELSWYFHNKNIQHRPRSIFAEMAAFFLVPIHIFFLSLLDSLLYDDILYDADGNGSLSWFSFEYTIVRCQPCTVLPCVELLSSHLMISSI